MKTKSGHTWVKGYTRRDGVRVKGHWVKKRKTRSRSRSRSRRRSVRRRTPRRRSRSRRQGFAFGGTTSRKCADLFGKANKALNKITFFGKSLTTKGRTEWSSPQYTYKARWDCVGRDPADRKLVLAFTLDDETAQKRFPEEVAKFLNRYPTGQVRNGKVAVQFRNVRYGEKRRRGVGERHHVDLTFYVIELK